MTNAFIWAPETGDDGLPDGFDSACVWALRYGRDWDVAAWAEREDPEDFNWQLVLETRRAGTVAELPAHGVIAGEVPVVKPHAAGLPATPGAASARLVLAPLDAAPLPDLGTGPAPAPDSNEALDAAADDTPDVTEVRFRAPLRKRSIATAHPAEVPYTAQGLNSAQAVLVGVIDDAINPVHSCFAAPPNPDGTSGGGRVDFAWVMDGLTQAGSSVPFGRLYQRAELDAARSTPHATEEGRLTALGLLDRTRVGLNPMARPVTHGTAVAGIAAGFSAQTPPRDARVACVSLPAEVTLDTSGATLAPFVLAGLDFILDRAFQMSVAEGFPIPVVVNFSYATSGGPHNGLHFLETAIDATVAAHLDRMKTAFPMAPDRRAVDVILPTGNNYLSRLHARTGNNPDADGKTILSLPWRILPGDASDNLLEVWVPRSATGLEVQITPPGGTTETLAGLSTKQALVLHADGAPNKVIGRAALDRQRGNESDGIKRKKRILIALAPTEGRVGAGTHVAPSGLWHIQVKARIASDEAIEAWVRRDEAPPGYHRPGLPSYLEARDYVTHTTTSPTGAVQEQDQPGCVVRRHGSLSGITTGQTTTVVGGWVGHALPADLAQISPTRYASASLDPANDAGQMRAPSLSARTDRSLVNPGIPVHATAPGSVATLNGTSVAAPQATRQRMMEWLGQPGATRHGLPETDARLGQSALSPINLT